MSRNDGGPAFPTQREVGRGGNYSIEYVDGMTLRDYFAAKALAGLISEPVSPGFQPSVFTLSGGKGSAYGEVERFAIAAYAIADAMLAERSKA